VPKNCFRIVMLEKTLENSSDSKEIKPVNPEYSLEGLLLKAEAPILWPPMQGANSMEKTLMLEKTEGRRRKEDRG